MTTNVTVQLIFENEVSRAELVIEPLHAVDYRQHVTDNLQFSVGADVQCFACYFEKPLTVTCRKAGLDMQHGPHLSRPTSNPAHFCWQV